MLGLEVSDRYPDTHGARRHGLPAVSIPTTTASRWSAAPERPRARSLNHFAFEVGSLDEVFRARAWLRERGVPIVFEGRRRAGCQIAVEFQDPDGNNLEIYWNIDQIGTNGAARPASEWRQAKTLEDAVKDPVAGQRLPQERQGTSAEVRRSSAARTPFHRDRTAYVPVSGTIA